MYVQREGMLIPVSRDKIELAKICSDSVGDEFHVLMCQCDSVKNIRTKYMKHQNG